MKLPRYPRNTQVFTTQGTGFASTSGLIFAAALIVNQNPFFEIASNNLEVSPAFITATDRLVVAAAIAYFWWGETFTLLGYVGSALILGDVILMVLDGLKQ